MPTTCASKATIVLNMHDIIFHVIFGHDRDTIKEFLQGSSARLQHIVKCQYLSETMQAVISPGSPEAEVPLDHLKAMFFLFLNVDMVLKEYVCNVGSKAAFAAAMNVKQCTEGLDKLHAWSMVGTRPISEGKARLFFLALHDTVVKRWLQDERKTCRDLLDAVKEAYLNS